MNGPGIPDRKGTAFVMIDIQEKFVPVIHDMQTVIRNAGILVSSSGILGIPLIATEQYPKGLGKSVIDLPVEPVEKTSFSCFDSDEFTKKLGKLKARSLVLFGIEAHVCVLKTALDALKNKYEVHVVADATSSRTIGNKNAAIERMRQSGVFVVSTEMILFQLLEKAGTEEFRKISGLIK